MLPFETEVEKLLPLVESGFDEACSFLAPIFTQPEQHKDVVLYAAGKTCERIYRYLKSKGVQVAAICDWNKRGAFLDSGLEIIPFETLLQKYNNAWIVVCTFNYSVDAITNLCLRGIHEKNILRATYSSNLAYFSTEEFLNTPDLYNGYKYAYELAHDETSRRIVLELLRRDFTGSHHLRKTSSLSDEFVYFDFEFGEKEVFVQAGCYTGDTVEAFIEFRNHNPRDVIYTFDGDDKLEELARKNLERYSNVHHYKLGLWDKNDTLHFLSEGNSRSRLLDAEWPSDYKNMLEVVSLDSFFADKPELPTFIELDIEGAEPQALLGAKHILQTAKPKLAICVYHCQDHIYSIPKIIKDINPGYQRFRFEQTVDNSLVDTVLFAD